MRESYSVILISNEDKKMKRILLNSIFILASAMLLVSCASIVEGINQAAYNANASFSIKEQKQYYDYNKSYNLELSSTVAGFEGYPDKTSITLEFGTIARLTMRYDDTVSLCVSKKDSEQVRYDGAIIEFNRSIMSITKEDPAFEFLGVGENDTWIYSVPMGRTVTFKINNVSVNDIAESITITPYGNLKDKSGYSTKYDQVIKDTPSTIYITVKGNEKKEMADDESTRLYNLEVNPVIYNTSLGVNIQGLSQGKNELTFRFHSLNVKDHKYEVAIFLAPEIEKSIGIDFYTGNYSINSNRYTFTSSREEISKTVLIDISDDYLLTDSYKEDRDIVLEFQIVDSTDNITYTKKIPVSFNNLQKTMSNLIEISVGTNCNTKAGALVDTKVYFNAIFETYGPEDQFNRCQINIYDPNGKRVYNSSKSIKNDVSSTKGSFKGWGNVEPMNEKDKDTLPFFVPSIVGEYTMEIISYESVGTGENTAMWRTTFIVR